MANTDDLVLLSLYSGLGGAELSLGMLHKVGDEGAEASSRQG